MKGRTTILCIGTLLLLLSLCASNDVSLHAAPSSSPATMPAPNSAFAPFAYFEANCARCHGAYGSAYGPDFGKKLDDEQLKKVIDDMAAGPGGAPIDARELQVLWGYHKALIAKSPFVVVTTTAEVNGQVVMTGEVTPGSTVTIDKVKATIVDHKWRVALPVAKQYNLNVKLNDSAFDIIVER